MIGAKSLAQQWQDLAKQLNAIGGALKNGEGWKKAWINMRSKTKQKAQEFKFALEKTGANTAINFSLKLTNLDERIIGVMTKVAIVGQEDVIEPLRANGDVQSVEILDCLDSTEIEIIEMDDAPQPPKRKKTKDERLSLEEKRLLIEEETLEVRKAQLEVTKAIKELLTQLLKNIT